MKCGDRGHLTAAGEPCGQTIGEKAAGCIWHTLSAEGRKAMALKGGIASRMQRALPSTYQVPEFASPENIIAFARELVRLALTEDVDLRRVSEARGAAGLALSAFTARTQERLVEALLRVEHGGAAMLLLTRLQDGLIDGRRRPLPGRPLSLSPSGTDAS